MSTPCGACAFICPAGTKFCPNCGNRFAVGVAPVMYPQQPPAQMPMYQQQQHQPMQQAGYQAGYAQHPPALWNGAPAYNAAPSPPLSAGAPPNVIATPLMPKITVPPAATGEEAATIYKRMIAAVRGANINNDQVVSAFKRDCKAFGQAEIKTKLFYERLVSYFGGAMMVEHMLPQLARLIPDDRMRKKLIKMHAKQTALQIADRSSSQQRPNSMVAMSTGNGYGAAGAGAGPPARASSASDLSSSNSNNNNMFSSATSKLRLHGYSDNPTCSICSAEFDHLKKRRHKCRKCGASVCSLCSPAKMLIPPEQIMADAKNYDPSHPQRVCTICAPLLHNFQDGMISQYANCHKENPHTSKTRLHLPYSKSLEQECRNAADIIGNFFRADFGANSDRSIPVAFLRGAHGLAFLTVIKAGFLISAKAGTGIVIAKLPNGKWSAPSAIGTAGLSGGFEVGGEIVEFMIILGSAGAVKVFHRTQVSIGGGLSVAVGPYGRDASAQAAASRGGINANYSYSHSRGLYVGVSLEGAVVTCRSDVNSNFYGTQFTPEEILNGSVPPPRAAQCLYDAVSDAMDGVAQHDANAAMASRATMVGSCINCPCQLFVSKAFSKKCKSCGHQHDKY